MKFRSEKHGNSCNFYRETVKPQQDPTLTCAICALSWATFIFSMFSVKDTCFEWMLLPWPIPSSYPERKGPVRGQDWHMNSSLWGQSPGEATALWPSDKSWQLPSSKGWKETSSHSWAWKKDNESFLRLDIFCYINRSTDTGLHGLSAQPSSDRV